MIITGTITQASQPSEPTGIHQVLYQDVIIADQNGAEWPGRIGSKQGYQTNTPISVTVEEKQGDNGLYNYFRKYNPQYPKGQQAAPQPSQAPRRPPQKPMSSPDWDAIAEGKVRHGLVCAAVQSLQIIIKGVRELEYWKSYIVTGRAPLPPGKDPIKPDPEIVEGDDDIPY